MKRPFRVTWEKPNGETGSVYIEAGSLRLFVMVDEGSTSAYPKA